MGKGTRKRSLRCRFGPLKQAVADLKPEAGKDPCYAAAIDDLTDLESATKSKIAREGHRPPCLPDGRLVRDCLPRRVLHDLRASQNQDVCQG